MRVLLEGGDISAALRSIMEEWLEGKDLGEGTRERAAALTAALDEALAEKDDAELKALREKSDFFVKRSHWIFGGDGWPTISATAARPRAGQRRRHQRPRLRHRSLFQHRRPVFQGHAHRGCGAVRRQRQDEPQERSGPHGHELRQRVRGADRHGRQPRNRPSRPSPKRKPIPALPSSSPIPHA